jgi:hypothetical protein
MTKMKFVFAVIAVLTGVGGAYATRIQQTDLTQHNWVDKNNTFIFSGTVADAEANCPGNDVFCLRASDSPATIVYMGQ